MGSRGGSPVENSDSTVFSKKAKPQPRIYPSGTMSQIYADWNKKSVEIRGTLCKGWGSF